MENHKYDLTLRCLHWVSAAVILWASISGGYAVYGSVTEAQKEFITSFNVSLTTAFIPVFFFRLYHRFSIKKQISEKGLPPAKAIAAFVHMLIYISTSIVLISGVLMMERDISVFGLVTIPNIFQDHHLTEFFFIVHRYSTIFLFALILLHVLAVIKHEIEGNGVLKRMF